jgi:heparan sulfate 6-O-sulfotransferase HS6ST1
MKNLKSVSVQVIDSDIALLLPNGVYEIKQMEPKSSRLRRIVFFCVALALFGIVGFGYFCPDKVGGLFHS